MRSRPERGFLPQESVSVMKITELSTCPICEHDYERGQMNKHHVVPKSRKGRETVLLCTTCHRQIHAVFTEKELERHFGTMEQLLAAEQFQSWIRWIRRRKPTARIRTKTAKRKRR